MGVGINYKGVGGNRHFDLNGVPTGEADALFKAPRKHKQLLPDDFKKALHPMPIDPIAKDKEGKVKLNAFDMRPDTLDKKTMPGSAVTTSMSGLCLEGEQQNPVVVGTKLYGSHGGQKGYYGFDEFDPPVSAKRVGALGAGGDGADGEIAKAGVPFSYQVASRLVMESDDLGRQILVEYDKDVQNTALGRSHTVTGERRRVVGIIDPNGSKSRYHPFRVTYDLDHKEWIVFLPERSLSQCYLNSASKTTYVAFEVAEKLPRAKNGEKGWYAISDAKVGYVYVNLASGGDDEEPEGNEGTKFVISCSESNAIITIAKITANDDSGHDASQLVFSALVFSSGGLGGAGGLPDGDTKYFADEQSLSLHSTQVAGPEENGTKNIFQISGFGRVAVSGGDDAPSVDSGSFRASEELEIEDEPTENLSVVCRGGDKDDYANTVVYRRLKLGQPKAPFRIDIKNMMIVNCWFYWDGELIQLPNVNIPETIFDGGSILLRGRQERASSSNPNPPWRWDIGAMPISSSNNDKVLNFLLYDLSGGKIVCDYRTTFLSMTDHTQKARLDVGRKGTEAKILLDASGDKPKLVVTDGEHSIELDIAQFGMDCLQSSIGIRKISWVAAGPDGVPTPAFAHVLACSDIDIPMLGVEPGGGGGGGGGGDVERGEITIEKGEDTNLWVNGNVNGAVGDKFKIDVYYS